MKLFLYSILSGAMLLTACQTGSKLTVDKRKYRKGYYVSFHKLDKPAAVINDSEFALLQQGVKASYENDADNSAGPFISINGAADSATEIVSNKQPVEFRPHVERIFKRQSFTLKPVTEKSNKKVQIMRPKIKKRHSNDLPQASSATDDKDDKRLLCIILAIFFPVLALYIYEGNSKNFKISLLIGLATLICLILGYILSFLLIPIIAALFFGLYVLFLLSNKIFAILKIANSKNSN